MEMLRVDDAFFQKFGQMYVSVAYPGVVKGWHYHKVQTDHFVIVKGMMKVVLYDGREDSPTKGVVNEFFMGEQNPILRRRFRPCVLHGMKGIGTEPAMLVNMPHRALQLRGARRVPRDPHENDIPYDWEAQGWLSGVDLLTRARPRHRGRRDSSARTSSVTCGGAFRSARVTVLDKLTYAGNLANLEAVQEDPRLSRSCRATSATGSAVAEAMAGCEVVVNFAAETHVDRSIDDAEDFVLTDTYGVCVLLEEARRAKVRRFLQISTDEVYGEILTGEADRGGAAPGAQSRTPRPRSEATGWPTPTTRPTGCRRRDAVQQQLRPVPVSREADPALRHERARGQAAPGLRQRAEHARLDPRRGPLRARSIALLEARTSKARPSTSRAGTSARCSRSRR